MPSPPSYKALDVFNLSKKLVVACYSVTASLPKEEKTNLTHYIRSSALKIHFNIAQGAFLKKKKKRKRFIKTAQNALLVIDAAVEVLVEVGFGNEEETNEVMELSSTCYQLLATLKKRK